MTTNKQLRELAEKAGSGHWYETGELRYHDDRSGEAHGLHHDEDGFIAAVGPATVLALLDEVEALQADRDQQYAMKVKAREQRDEVTTKLSALYAECEELRTALAESRANDRQAMAYLDAVRGIVGGDSFPEMIGRVKDLQIERNGCKLALKEWLEKSEQVAEKQE